VSENLSLLSGRHGLDRNLFEELVDKARASGTPSPADLSKLAEEYLMGPAITYGAASFYDFLKPANLGKKAFVCNGSTCLLAGTQDRVHGELSKHLPEEAIGHMCCLGRCHENGAFHFDGKNYSARSAEQIEQIVKGKSAETAGKDSYHVSSNLRAPILVADFPGTESYFSALLQALAKSPGELLDELKLSGLRGRGGAGFPMALKWEGCMKSPGAQKYIVCNADEGDPGAYSDRYLLEQRPHSVLFGMMIAGYITGANAGVLYIRAEYPEAVQNTADAVRELEQAGYLGKNIKGSGFDFEFKVIKGAGAYICGEETALLSSLEGQRPEVRVRPPYPTVEGLFNKPTVVNNVETFASVHYILGNGGRAYAGLGKGRSTGSKLVCLDGFFKRPGVYEVEMGTPLRTVIDEMGQGFREPIKALHVGGPLGGLVPLSKIDDLDISFESFSEHGFLLGHASIVCVPATYPLIKYLEHLFEFTAAESCGKCFPCRLGSTRGQEMLLKAQKEDYRIDRQLFDDLLETMEIGSLCALGGGLPLSIRNALQYFPDELKQYFAENKAPAASG